MVTAERLQVATMPEFPRDILDAMERGDYLTPDQIRRMVEIEAKALGMDFEEVLHAARIGALPKDAIGTDLAGLIQLLDAPA